MSPVYERTYRTWEGTPTSRTARIRAIAREALGAATRSRWLWVLVVATVVHLAIRAVILYATGQIEVPPGAIDPALQDRINFTPGFLAEALSFQGRWILMLTLALTAAPALARDLRAGALTFYFSKPVTRTGYGLGKLLPSLLIGLGLTALPLALLWVVGYGFTPEPLLPDGLWTLFGTGLLSGLIVTLVATLVALAVSSLVESTSLAAGAWVGLSLLSGGVAQLLHAATGREALLLVDLFGVLDRVARSLLGAPGGATPETGAWLVALAWSLGSLALIAWRLGRPEVGA